MNRYLQLDQNKERLLAPLDGKVIAVNVQPFDETLYLCPTADAIRLLDAITTAPDTRITGTPWALGWMGLSGKPMRALFAGDVKIEGDVHVGRKFQQLFEQLDINLEGKLALYTGDWFAGQIGNFFRTGRQWGKNTLETFELNLSEYLQEETRDLPAAAEMDIFYHDIDDLRIGYDRLERRISRLESRMSKQQGTNPKP